MTTEYGPEEFAREFHVSRETMARLCAYDAVLLDWTARINLISKSTLASRWERHYRDSAQLNPLLPDGATSLLDIGSGAGFPGLVLAAMNVGKLSDIKLVDSIRKKTTFLCEARNAMDLPSTEIINGRSESLDLSPPDVVTARAVAALPKLFDMIQNVVGPNTVCLLPKGQHVGDELTAATKSWHMTVEQYPSITASESGILAVRNLRRRH
ncbi:MAG: 16S rRNA (guanine(527)-N(7))-methyltransferase RsmG [Pseudomonadota bacterium]